MKYLSPLLIASTCLFTFACGSSDGKTGSTDPVTGTQTQGLCGKKSGFDGDQLCIEPPPAGEGIQIHVGPADYDDPDAVAPYLLPAGEENVRCFNTKLPESDFYYLRQQSRMRPSSHHMLISVINDTTTQEGPTDVCDLISSAGAIPGSQTPSRDFPDQLAPEDDGIARYLPKATIASFQLHYVNTTTKPVLREAWVNLYKEDPANVKQALQGVFLVGDLAANIPPNTVQTTTLEFTPAVTEKTRIFQLNGHSHAHAETFTVWKIHGGQETEIYKSFDWAEPKELTYNSVTTNAPPNEVTKEDGGTSGDLYIEPGDTLRWSCLVNNDTQAALHFANEAHTAEMCLLAGTYIGKTGGLMRSACASGKCFGGAGPIGM